MEAPYSKRVHVITMSCCKYVTDHEFPLSPFTGKSPWVTLNGEELHDSQLIVEALTRKFGKDCK